MTRAHGVAGAIGAMLSLVSVRAHADVAVTVIDRAGDTAYVSPGRTAGIVVGASVQLGGKTWRVVEVTDKTAAVQVDDSAAIAIGATGSAQTKAGDLDARSTPRAQSEFVEQWPPAALPATTQTPMAVPIGGKAGAESTKLEVIGSGFGTADKTGIGGQAEARVMASFAVMSERPLGADLDVAARAFGSGWNAHEREPWVVRAAQLRYGDASDPSLMIGRLRYAATAVGMLDGGRAAAHVGDFELAAFGGLVPDPVNGKPDTSASRFGAEAIWDRASSSWQPRVALTAYGSTWQGQLDERRLSLAASANHGATWVDAWADAQQFPSGNPFGASSVELTGAGASASWRSGGVHLGFDATYLRPEQSLRLASTISDDWICARVPHAGDVDEPCKGGDAWYSTTASAGISRERWAIDAVGSLGRTTGIATTNDAAGYVRGQLRGTIVRLIVALSGGRTELADWIAPELGIGAAPSKRFDIAVSYRPERLDYAAATGAIVMQSIVMDLHYAASAAIDVAISALASTGGDGDSLQVLGVVVWRPRR